MYQTEFEGKHHELGTSGFLYRSNKLMYDHETESYWSTLKGTPVVGPLVGKGIQLERRHVVTTTWGEWKKRHPNTTVLSTSTGHRRDYGEGVAYRDYFSTDKLMFIVPKTDQRLLNKDEVLALRVQEEALAISADFLRKNPVYKGAVGKQEFVVLTDATGANRVYETDGVEFASWDQRQSVSDRDGVQWTLSEDSITNPDGKKLIRLPAHRAFWFGWQAQFPKTRLIK